MTIPKPGFSNGVKTVKDLKDYRIKIREPVQFKCRGFKITAGSAPTDGFVTLRALSRIYRELLFVPSSRCCRRL